MSPEVWKQLSVAAFVATAVSLGASQVQWAMCSHETATQLGLEFDAASTDALAQRVLAVQAEYEEGALPKDTVSRMGITGPVCRAAHPYSDALPFGAASLLLFVLGFFARNQSSIVAERDLKERTRRRPENVTLFDKPNRVTLNDEALEHTLPDSIEVSVDFDLGLETVEAEDTHQDEGDSLMDFVEERRHVEEAKVATEDEDEGEGLERFGGFYCPNGYGDKPVLYVDGHSKSATDRFADDDDRLDNPARPFKTLTQALVYASKRVIKDTPGIQVRVAPGVYQGALSIPDRCVVVNQRMPGDAPAQRRLQWLMAQGLDDPDRVTILPPADAPVAVGFAPGQRQGIYGCYIVGREGVPQSGLLATASLRLTIFNCVFDSFGKSGVRLENSGAELPGHGVNISACQFLENTAGHGGGINVKTSVVNVRDCMFQKNRAHSGGAIWAEELKRPILIRGCRFSKNTAQGPEPGEIKPSSIPFDAWIDMEGLGGAVVLKGCRGKVTGSEFVDNKSNVAGGALAALGAQVVVQGDEDHDVRFEGNNARLGGAIFALGWPGSSCTLKLETGEVLQNRAKHSGGGVCGFGYAVIQMIDTRVAENSVEHDRGLGGGIGLHNGAEFLCKDSDILENSSKGAGGGIGAINAHVKVGDGVDVRANKAKMAGGGVFAITEANEVMEEMVSVGNFKLPFVLATQDCMIAENTADDLGAGLRAGNFAPRSTFPLGVKLGGKTRLRNNRTKHPNAAGDDLWIVWNGETKGSTKNRPVEKMLLK